MDAVSVALLIVLASIIFLTFVKKRKSVRVPDGKRLPPGPIRFPIFGTIPQMVKIDKDYAYKQINGLRKVYGDIISLGFGVHYAVALCSFEMMKDLIKRDETNQERFRFQFVTQRSMGKNLGLIWNDGASWKQVRKFTFSTLREFGFGKSREMEAIIQEEIDCLMDLIREEFRDTKGIWSVNPNHLSGLAVNALWKSVAGERFDPRSAEIQRHMEMNAESTIVMGPTNLLSAFPFLKVFPKWSGYEQSGKLLEKARGFMRELVDNVKHKRNGRVKAENFVEVFLDEIEKNRGVNETVMTEDQLIVTLLDLFLASTESTSTVMDWVILELALNPAVQQKARLQIQALLAERKINSISLAERNCLPYIKAIILETFRHCPAFPLPPPRRVTADITYGEYFIPKGTGLLFNLYAVNTDKSFWGDVDTFRPERYPDISEMEIDQDRAERMAHFGFGKRTCPGESMGNDILFLFVASLLQNFSISVVKGREATLTSDKPGVTIRPIPYLVAVKDLQIQNYN